MRGKPGGCEHCFMLFSGNKVNEAAEVKESDRLGVLAAALLVGYVSL